MYDNGNPQKRFATVGTMKITLHNKVATRQQIPRIVNIASIVLQNFLDLIFSPFV